MIEITGSDLTLSALAEVARGAKIQIPDSAQTRVQQKHRTMLTYASDGNPVYGLNRGVGFNKDKNLANIDEGSFDDNNSRAVNRRLIYSHCVSFGDYCEPKTARAIAAAKLNTLVKGYSGVHPRVPEAIVELLNVGVAPALPSRGSIGDSDITVLAHLGLCLMGEGEFWRESKIVPAQKVLDTTAFEPVDLVAKDALAIMSSNAFSNARAGLVSRNLNKLIEVSELTGALSLEALHGNTEPFDEEVSAITDNTGQQESAGRIRDHLTGSFLWEDPQESLQDPLSFRCLASINGSCRDQFNQLKNALHTQLNASEDNPAVLDDRVSPTGNFQNMSWTPRLSALLESVAHAAGLSARRIRHVIDPHYRDLEYGLPPDENNFGLATLPYSAVYLEREIRSRTGTEAHSFQSLAQGIEDHASGAPFIVENAYSILEDWKYLLGIEALAAAHALECSQQTIPNDLGETTTEAYTIIRNYSDPITEDRILTEEIEKLAAEVVPELMDLTCNSRDTGCG